MMLNNNSNKLDRCQNNKTYIKELKLLKLIMKEMKVLFLIHSSNSKEDKMCNSSLRMMDSI